MQECEENRQKGGMGVATMKQQNKCKLRDRRTGDCGQSPQACRTECIWGGTGSPGKKEPQLTRGKSQERPDYGHKSVGEGRHSSGSTAPVIFSEKNCFTFSYRTFLSK